MKSILSRKNGVLLIQKRKKVLSSLLHRLTREMGIALTVSLFWYSSTDKKTRLKLLPFLFFKHKDAVQILDAKVSFMHFVPTLLNPSVCQTLKFTKW